MLTATEVADSQPAVKPCEAFRLHPRRKAGSLGPRRPMNVRRITKADFDRIAEVINHWWGGPIGTFAHPIFFYELGDQALVVEQGSELIGFLLGFTITPSAGPRTGYVHLVGIHPDHRRRGVGRLLYDRFAAECRDAGCVRMKAITTPGNEGWNPLSRGPRVERAGSGRLRRSGPPSHRVHQAPGGLTGAAATSAVYSGCDGLERSEVDSRGA